MTIMRTGRKVNCMKNRTLLFLIPAFLALTSCNLASPKIEGEPKQDENIFVEDTLAHEELFGDKFDGRMAKEYRSMQNLDNGEHCLVGIQKHVDGDNTSIRFVAAIDIAEGELDDYEAVWTRTIYSDSFAEFKSTAHMESKKVYTSINNSGEYLSIDGFAGKTFFIVYTLLDIPSTTYANYFINTFLTVSKKDKSVEYTSKVISTKVDFSFQKAFSNDSYFLSGKIGGVSNSVKMQDVITQSTGNNASFSFNATSEDDFYIVKAPAGSSELSLVNDFKDASPLFTIASNKLSPNDNGNYVLYVNSSDEIYNSAVTRQVRKFFVSVGDVAGWWFNESAYTAVYAWGPAGTKFLDITKDGNFYETETVDTLEYNSVIVLRMKNGESPSTDDGKYWNKTMDSSISTDSNICLYVHDYKDGGGVNQHIGWGTK